MICLILFPTSLKCTNLEVVVSLKNLDNQSTSANKISIEVDGVHRDFKLNENGNYCLKENINCEKIDSYEISLDFGKPYLNRNIRISGSSGDIKKSIKLFKAQDNNYNYKYLQKGLEFVNIPPYDKALAYYEAPKKKYQLIPLDQYNVCLYYNYAIALANTYKFDNYDNYNLAKLMNLFDNDNNRKYFIVEQISKDKLIKFIEDLKNYKFKIERIRFLNKYQKVQDTFKEGNFLETANMAENQLILCENNPKLCKSTSLNADRFLTDIGVSYLKAAEQGEKEQKPREEIIKYLNNAKDALEKVERLDLKTVHKNLHIIRSKLISYQ